VPFKSWYLSHPAQPDIAEPATGRDLGHEYLAMGAGPLDGRHSRARSRIGAAAFLLAMAAMVVAATLTVPASRPVQHVWTASSGASVTVGVGVPAPWNSAPTSRVASNPTGVVAPVSAIAPSVAPQTR
jgi:hypothetical protein